MNRKTIQNVLSRKFGKWVKSIDDENVRDLVNKNSIITGGCIVSMFLNEKINDFDIYFTNKETTLAVANYYVNEFNKTQKADNQGTVITEGDRVKIQIVHPVLDNLDSSDDNENIETEIIDIIQRKQKEEEKGKYRPVFLSDNAITLTDKIQIIIRFYGAANQIHENYDFVHCTNYWLSDNQQLYTNSAALESILSKNLYYVGSLYPLCSIIRTRKFIKRGWHINAGQYLKMAVQLNDLDLNNVRVLQDQLVGVDIAYFNEVLSIIREKQEENPNFELDSTYLCEIIDKVFN